MLKDVARKERDKFPFELSPIGWVVFVVLLLLVFYLYYTEWYGDVSAQYRDMMWSATRTQLAVGGVKLRVNTPKTISDFTDSEIRAQIWNSDSEEKKIDLVVSVQVYSSETASPGVNNHLEGCIPVDVNSPFVYVSTIPPPKYDNSQGMAGASAFTLQVPPHGSANENLWLILQLDSDLPDNACFILSFYELTSQYVSECEKDSSPGTYVCPVGFDNNLEGKFVIRFNREETLYRYVYENFLVPPWLNAFILFLVWLIAWLIDIYLLPLIEPKYALG